ncbi:helix-turn-helix transcriptional regulator [Nocardia harenae]|uniref:helix-turn-helix transcriptional regulator n=1 Tax=Nocardia harenae TaxID=358707 RepID=UPI000830D54E|nr:AraC family transcriptional regulator [Nocardia harenae]
MGTLSIPGLRSEYIRLDANWGELTTRGVVVLLAAHLVGTYAAGARPPCRLGLRDLRRVDDFIGANLSERIGIENLAAAVPVSPFHFARTFRATTGMTPLEYLTARRIETAVALLRRPGGTVLEVAAAVGYTNVGHFRRLLVRHTGATAAQLRTG